MPNDKNPLDQLRQATATLRGNARDGARPASEKNSLAVVLKARAVAWLTGIDAALLTPSVFKSLSWLAVVLALLSAVFGAKWAAAYRAISLADFGPAWGHLFGALCEPPVLPCGGPRDA